MFQLISRPIKRVVAAAILYVFLASPFAGILPSAKAQLTVVDPGTHANILIQTQMQIVSFGKEIAHQAEMIGHQLTQISQLGTQITQFTTIIKQGIELARVVGDPQKLLGLCGLGELVTTFKEVSELVGIVSHPMAFLHQVASPLTSLTTNATQLFSSGKNISTTLSTGFLRDLTKYKGYAVLESQLTQMQALREKDRKTQIQCVEKIKTLTAQLNTASDNATRDTLVAGIHATQAVAAASHNEVVKAQADYGHSVQAKAVADQKQQTADAEEFVASLEAARAAQHQLDVKGFEDALKADAALAKKIESKSPGLTAGGYELIRFGN